MKNYIILILLLLVVGGCSPREKLMVRMENGVSLSEYKVFEVMPVSNETGKTFEFDVADELTQHIKAKIKDKGYVINERKEVKDSVLVIKSSLMTYEPGSAGMRLLDLGVEVASNIRYEGIGDTRATVRTSFIDKMTGKVIGEMVITEQVGTIGRWILPEESLLTVGAYKKILGVVAKAIANEIDKNVKGD